ncbi:hypothetical protein FRC08_011866, partial [Ceratobasidium sp. 394]
MSETRVIAIAGATGYVGRPTVEEILKSGAFELRILTRKSGLNGSLVQSFKERGAVLHGVSYDDEAELVSVLQGVDIVLSTLSGAGITDAQ